jgi:hypothetical protein
VRIGDEVVNLSSLSNDASVSNAPTLGVTVASLGDESGAPRDTVALEFQVTNEGNIVDQYAISATETLGWELIAIPTMVALDPSTSTTVPVRLRIPTTASAGDTNLVTVTATSLSDNTVTDSDEAAAAVELDPASTLQEGAPLVSALELTGANPFSDQVAFRLILAETAPVSISVFDTGGRLVQRLIDGEIKPAGAYPLSWNGRDEEKREAASGVYFVAVRAGGWSEQLRVLRTR